MGDAASLYTSVREAIHTVEEMERLERSAATSASRDKALLVTGKAGTGKTHLFCDIARQRLEEGRPTVLLLGQDFDRRALRLQIPELSEFDGSLEDLLASMDAASEVAGAIGIVMIDALNESEHPEGWVDELRALRQVVGGYPNVPLAVSCRTEFVPTVVGENDMASIEHVGFAEATDRAVARFAHEYGLEPPSFPTMNPEFTNPLFLKLTCEALSTLGHERFRFGSAGLLTVHAAFLDAVNTRLSSPSRCDYDPDQALVQSAVRSLAQRDGPDRAAVLEVTETLLPGRSWSRSLMHGLLTEGVLIASSQDRFAFGYQRIRDIARATAIAERPAEEMRAWLQDLGTSRWREAGTLGALAILLPEAHGAELVDLVAPADGQVPVDEVERFVQSIVLRSAESISERTIELVRGILLDGRRAADLWDGLVRVASIPGHPLNADWLHSCLIDLDVAERDFRWSTRIVGALDGETAVRRLLEWAWPPDARTPSAPDEVRRLCATALGWLLATSDRTVRDQATKALVCLLETAPTVARAVLQAFSGVNDPYVMERLAAATCSLALRATAPAARVELAEGVVALLGDNWPEHLLARDFARRVVEAARVHGWQGPASEPPYGAAWPLPTRSTEEIAVLAGPPDYAYGSIWHSLTGMGDFGRYVLQPALRHMETDEPNELRGVAERAVFDRALGLGWTPGRFAQFDRGRTQTSGRGDAIERVGKKYQWIGLYEVLGRIADHCSLRPEWSGEKLGQYTHAEQLVWRDIDPSLTVHAKEAPAEPTQWFSPVTARFNPAHVDTYPEDMDGVPDPLDLIEVADSDGTSWLVLVANPVWEAPQAPEIGAMEAPRLTTWMQAHAYIVAVPDLDDLAAWVGDKDWFGHWMPDTPEIHNALLAAHPHDATWSGADGQLERWQVRAGPQPCPLSHGVAWYGGTGTSRDASGAEEVRGYVPTALLHDTLGLTRLGDFVWGADGRVDVQDPSIAIGGPSALIARRKTLVDGLAAANLAVFWTVLVGKELNRLDFTPPSDDLRWVSASSSYALLGREVRQLHAVARLCAPGPTVVRSLDWPPRGGA
ncbi:MAG: NACHT domain-containing protein [Acidimicrobiales bacterium]